MKKIVKLCIKTRVAIRPLLKDQTILYVSFSPAHGELENLCFFSVAPTVCVSRAFVYIAVNANKMVVIYSIKPLSYPYT